MVDFDKFYVDSKQIKQDRYTDAYPHLLSYFKNKSILTETDFMCGIHMVYAWMPTVLKLHFSESRRELDTILSIINSAKKNGSLEECSINFIASVVNNSVVGTSKFLHFISPEAFPIWDSRVYSYLNNNAAYGYRLNSASAYLDYIESVKSIIAHKRFPVIQTCVDKKMKYKVSAMRAAELVMFQNSPKIEKKQ